MRKYKTLTAAIWTLPLQICLMDEMSVRLTAVKVVIDILMYLGSTPFLTNDKDQINNSDEDLFEEEEVSLLSYKRVLCD